MKRTLEYIAVWVTAALVIGLLLGSLNLARFSALASDGVKTFGTVFALEPSNHQTVHYTYQAGRATYKGLGTVGEGNPSFGSLSHGDSILLYYAATNPASSALGDPHARLRNEIISVAIPVLLFPSILVFGFIRKRRRSRQ
jgi:hypothetical protein